MSQLWKKVLYLPLAFALGSGSALAQASEGFIVHEWGTFTSLQGSDGKNQEGMHHEEEHLPTFVRGRCGSMIVHGDNKCADFMPEAGGPLGVTQKMETPVIYFYGGEGQKASVQVGFPKGIISQWYPEASAFTPGLRDVKAVADGSMTWDVLIQSPAAALTDRVKPGSNWLPARDVDAHTVTVGQTTEKFIFYRGLGRFDTPVQVVSTESGSLRVHNTSAEKVPAVFLLGFNGSRGFVKEFGSIAPRNDIHIPALPEANLQGEDFLRHAQALVKRSLIESGLYPKEAEGMVKTWEKSYFLTPGLRVLFVLPRSWSDEILPLDVKPAPSETVRTLVGRIEVMTRQEEVNSLAAMTAALNKGPAFDMTSWGRLQEAKLRRLLSLSQNPEMSQALQEALNQLSSCQQFPCR